MCPNAIFSDEETSIWSAIFGSPIAKRLNDSAPGAQLTPSNVPNLMSLCAFESLAKLSRSPFCDIFSSSEFDQFEYFSDLHTFYGTGYSYFDHDQFFFIPTHPTDMGRTSDVYKE